MTLAAAAVLGVFAVLLLVRMTTHIRYSVPSNGAEAVVLSVAWSAARGEPIYNLVERPPAVFCVYNPIVPYLCGLTMYLFGPTAVPIRILVSLFYFASGLAVYLLVRRETASAAAALVAALVLLTGRYIWSAAGSAVSDYPALFFSLIGLYLWGTKGRGRYWATAAFVLAFFTKQCSIAAAAAAFSAILFERRRLAGAGFVALFPAGVGLGLLACAALFGKPYFVNACWYVGIAPFDALVTVRRALTAFVFFAAPLAAWAFWLARSLTERRPPLWALYVFFALLVALSSGRQGAGRQYWFDFSAGMSIAVGLLWARAEARAKAGRLTRPVVAVFALQAAIFALGTWHGSGIPGAKDPAVLRREEAVARAFRENSGIILCRYSGLEVGGTAANCSSDIFKLIHLIDAGIVPRSILLDGVRQERFSMVIMPEVERNFVVFTDDMKQAVAQHYVVKHEASGNIFLVPLGGAD